MKKKQRVPSLLSGLGLLLALWICHVGGSLFLRHNDVPFELSPPETATLLLELNGKELFNEALTSTFISSRDEQISELLMARAGKLDNEELRLGIDLLNHMILFRDELNGQHVNGVLLKINNPRLWDKHSSALLDETTYCMRVGGTGVIIRSKGLSQQQLQRYAAQQIVRKTPQLKATDHSIQFQLSEPLLGWNRLTGNVASMENTLQLNALFEGQQLEKKDRLTTELKPAGFHLTLDFLVAPDSLFTADGSAILQTFGIPVRQLTGMSMNYYGLTIVNSSSGLLPLPNADLIFSFRTTFSCDTLLRRIQEVYPNAEVNNHSFIIDGFKYYIDQLDSKTIYLGITKNPATMSRPESSLIRMSGNLVPFTKIAGGKLLTTMIRMNSAYQLLNDLSERVKDVQLELVADSNGHQRMTGSVHFEEGMDATVELIRLFLETESRP